MRDHRPYLELVRAERDRGDDLGLAFSLERRENQRLARQRARRRAALELALFAVIVIYCVWAAWGGPAFPR